MKRLYTEVAIATQTGGVAVLLDGRPLRTPAQTPLLLPSPALAAAIAEEWREQEAVVKPAAMPLTRLASTALDLVAARREAVVAEVANYAGTDLICYRAAHPPALVARQHATWQPLLDWATLRYDAPLAVTSGVVPVAQPAAALKALEAAVAAHDPMRLTALHAATTTSGSLVIGLALLEGRIAPAAAFEAAQLDESFEIEHWGEDAEQTQRRDALRADLAAIARFVAALRAPQDED